ncbi:MAG: VOC family protein [Alphaproteobacteria bacterium]|nr:VOC family protein [Alphaproteobacteria bacterium]
MSTPPPGTILWHEIAGRDPAALRAFYGELFGWQLTTTRPDYDMFTGPDGQPTGGIGAVGEHSWTTFYVAVDDIDAALTRARALGASPLSPVREDGPNLHCVVADPDGRPIGLVQHRSMAAGAPAGAVPSA